MLKTFGESRALSQAATETENARAALAWSQAEYSALGAPIALSLGTLLERRGLHGEALSTLETGLKLLKESKVADENDGDLRVSLLREHAGVLLDLQQWKLAARSARSMLRLCREANDRAGIAFATNLIGLANKGEEKWKAARDSFLDALLQFENLADLSGIAIAHNNLGLIEYLDARGDKTQAKNHLQRALELRLQLQDERSVAEAHINLGALAQQVDALDEAQNHYQAALKIELRLLHSFGIGRALCNLGEVAESRGEIERAYRLYISAHALFELSGVAHQKYSAIQSARLAGSICDGAVLIAQSQQLARSGALEELATWAIG